MATDTASHDQVKTEIRPQLKHLFIRMLDTCNLECAHCYASCGPKSPDRLSYPELKLVIDQLPDLDIDTVHLEGGEALIHSDFWRILDDLNRVAIKPAITSNGLIVRERTIERLKGRVKRLTFSVDGYDSITHDRIRRRIGSFQRVTDAIRMSIAGGISTHMISVIWKQTAPRVDKIVYLAEALGVERLLLFSCGRIGAAMEHLDELMVDDETWFSYLENIRELAQARPWVWFEIDRVQRSRLSAYIGPDYQPVCTRSTRNSVIIDAKGDVYPCGYFIPHGRKLGHISDGPLSQFLTKPSPGERFSGACKSPSAVQSGTVQLCKLISQNRDTLPPGESA